MTRVWAAFALVGIILTLSYTEYYLCQSTSEELLKITQQIEVCDDYEKIEEYCDRMKEIWNGRKNMLEIFLYHSDADDIDNSIEIIKRLAEYKDMERIYTECGKLKNKLVSLSEAETVNPHNIL